MAQSILFPALFFCTVMTILDAPGGRIDILSTNDTSFGIQIVLFLVLRGRYADHLTLAFWTFFDRHKILVAYLVIINFVTFAAFAVDKIAAIERKSRIRIVTLLSLAFFGGSVGGLIAMYQLRHKTRKDYFTVGIPLIIVMQIVLLFYTMNAAW